MENFAIVASLIIFIALFFQILIFNKSKNLSLGFKLGKFRDSGLLNIIYGFIFANFLILIKIIYLNLRLDLDKKKSR